MEQLHVEIYWAHVWNFLFFPELCVSGWNSQACFMSSVAEVEEEEEFDVAARGIFGNEWGIYGWCAEAGLYWGF